MIPVDALSVFLNDMAATDAASLRGVPLGGFATKPGGSILVAHDPAAIYSTISEGCWKALFAEEIAAMLLKPGENISLLGQTAIPCVCEIPQSASSLFSEAAGAKIVAEGVTWQSLYLVLLDQHLILAEPELKYVRTMKIFVVCSLVVH